MKKIQIKKYLFSGLVGIGLFVLPVFLIIPINKVLADDCPVGTTWLCDTYLAAGVPGAGYLCSVGDCGSQAWSVGLPCSTFPDSSSFPYYGSFCSNSVSVFCTNGAAYDALCGGYCFNDSQCLPGLSCSSHTCVNPACPSISSCVCPLAGSCGTANYHTFSCADIDYSSSYTQCSTGYPTISAFPVAGSYQSWQCSTDIFSPVDPATLSPICTAYKESCATCTCTADYYRINNNTTSVCIGYKTGGVCSNCKKITNNQCWVDFFVPAKTSFEWDKFIDASNYFDCVQITPCI